MTRHAPTTPRRIQRRRAKGWRMPDGAIYVGRPTKWGNATRPVEATRAGHQWAVEQYAVDLWEHRLPVTPADARRELAGRDLACWCPPHLPCHADVLLQAANQEHRP